MTDPSTPSNDPTPKTAESLEILLGLYVHDATAPIMGLRFAIEQSKNTQDYSALKSAAETYIQSQTQMLRTLHTLVSSTELEPKSLVDLNQTITQTLSPLLERSSAVSQLDSLPKIEGRPKKLALAFFSFFLFFIQIKDDKATDPKLSVRSRYDEKKETIEITINAKTLAIDAEKLDSLRAPFKAPNQVKKGEYLVAVGKKIVLEHAGAFHMASSQKDGTEIRLRWAHIPFFL